MRKRLSEHFITLINGHNFLLSTEARCYENPDVMGRLNQHRYLILLKIILLPKKLTMEALSNTK